MRPSAPRAEVPARHRQRGSAVPRRAMSSTQRHRRSTRACTGLSPIPTDDSQHERRHAWPVLHAHTPLQRVGVDGLRGLGRANIKACGGYALDTGARLPDVAVPRQAHQCYGSLTDQLAKVLLLKPVWPRPSAAWIGESKPNSAHSRLGSGYPPTARARGVQVVRRRVTEVKHCWDDTQVERGSKITSIATAFITTR